MYQALYRKYRPRSFDDVCGQDHITSVLKTQVANGRTTHAYIFCGCRGTGKTTCAKIFAKAINCENPQNGEPCNACPTCLGIQEERIFDVVEMDAASNNGVDDVRALCDEVQYLPTEAKKKVYIIDEVHMLSDSAFNALLKTIEEPPEHVVFVFATTEMNKIPATVLSRCQRFDFKRITPEIIRDRVMQVAKLEGIPLEEGGARLIARLADGAMRDALSLLEACQGHEGTIDQENIQGILGLGNRETDIALCRAVSRQDTVEALNLLGKIYEDRSDFKQIVGDLIRIYRDLLVVKTVPQYANYIDAYDNELEEIVAIADTLPLETVLYQSRLLEEFFASYDRIATDKRASGEILLIRLCRQETSMDPDALASRLAILEEKVERGNFTPAPAAPAEKKREEKKPNPPPAPEPRAQGEQEYQEKAKLKNLLQGELSIKYWVPKLRFVRDGNVLRVLAEPFTKGMLEAAGGEDLILKHASSLTPDITKVVVEELRETAEKPGSDLEDL